MCTIRRKSVTFKTIVLLLFIMLTVFVVLFYSAPSLCPMYGQWNTLAGGLYTIQCMSNKKWWQNYDDTIELKTSVEGEGILSNYNDESECHLEEELAHVLQQLYLFVSRLHCDLSRLLHRESRSPYSQPVTTAICNMHAFPVSNHEFPEFNVVISANTEISVTATRTQRFSLSIRDYIVVYFHICINFVSLA